MDFRSALAACAAAGEVAEVDDEVDRAHVPKRDRDEERRRNRALVFRRVSDADAAIVGNLYGSAKPTARSTLAAARS